MNTQALTLDDIRRTAPSVFATTPWDRMSEKYRFFPTSEIVGGLMQHGFQPVKAGQSRSRIEGKANFTKHLLRFRHPDLMGMGKVGEEIPEIVLMNSHDGTSSYRLMLGFFRLVCSNGMVVKSGQVDEIRVRHSGRETLLDDVIEGTFEIISQAPRAVEQVAEWKETRLSRDEQRILAGAALTVRETAIEVEADELLRPRRFADQGEGESRDVYRTMNTIQERIVRGLAHGRDAKGERRKLRAINSVDGDTRFNRALWELTERMHALKSGTA